VSNLGNVKSLERTITGKNGSIKPVKEKIIKPYAIKKGYLVVSLYKEGKREKYLVHRLVAEAFIPNPDNLPFINHKNEIKTDNRATENLEWCDSKYNMNYGTRNQRASKKMTNHPKLSKPVLQYDLEGNFIKEWYSVREVERKTGFNQSCISACCRNTNHYRTAYGYIWKYKEKAA
jgi:hypothetical protein